MGLQRVGHGWSDLAAAAAAAAFSWWPPRWRTSPGGWSWQFPQPWPGTFVDWMTLCLHCLPRIEALGCHHTEPDLTILVLQWSKLFHGTSYYGVWLSAPLTSEKEFPCGSDSKESACNAGEPGSIPGSGRSPLEKEMATHSSVLAWKIPWTEEPDRLQSTGSKRVGHDWATSLSKSDKKYPRTVSRTQMSAHIRKGSFFLEITGFLWFGRHMPPSTDGRVVGWLGNLGHIHPGGSSCSGEV